MKMTKDGIICGPACIFYKHLSADSALCDEPLRNRQYDKRGERPKIKEGVFCAFGVHMNDDNKDLKRRKRNLLIQLENDLNGW